jgi:hypothetical protein
MYSYEDRPTYLHSIRVIGVSVYLLFVGIWLVLTRRIKVKGLDKAVKRFFGRPYAGELRDFRHDDGHSWVASVPSNLLSDEEAASCLGVFEGDRQLGPGHSPHDEIRRQGNGRFSHWGAKIYLSTSDNSSPVTNGRRYHVREIPR